MPTVKQLQAELAAAKAEINRLQQQSASTLERLGQASSTTVPTRVFTATVPRSPASPPSLQLKPPTKRPPPPELESVPLQKASKSKYAPPLPSQTAAARTFSPPSTNHGSLLRRLPIKSSCVLDIHYPDRHLVAFLIHNDYEAEVHSQLEKFEIPLCDDYDPLDPNNLQNSYYDNFNQDEKECAAWSVFTQRTRRNKNSGFGKQYMIYWEHRKDQAFETDVNNDARITISFIQQLVSQIIREKAKDGLNFLIAHLLLLSHLTLSSDFLDPSSSGCGSFSASKYNMPLSENITKALEQASNLVSNLIGHLNIIDLSSDSVVDTLKEHITEEEYMKIISSLKTEEFLVQNSVKHLIQAWIRV
ncbi:hypothetical protein G6F46_009509 [Rhizopus delemar]|nr:hypothetical protein G6F36_011036 [Rhizopus arrhizus]KAG1456782.1 hypothetical protein G6F55_006306 [Rhizopus delemar]KAG1492880.1 hypothetical protein G6F54_008982 [Rhizopus delemar]KAG1506983.1 hypothetical protein G6F53_009287 [Rhizopus delemar]KAG1520850.1 hypothetical protein G6F52_007280 [Rhizopus delemar]